MTWAIVINSTIIKGRTFFLFLMILSSEIYQTPFPKKVRILYASFSILVIW